MTAVSGAQRPTVCTLEVEAAPILAGDSASLARRGFSLDAASVAAAIRVVIARVVHVDAQADERGVKAGVRVALWCDELQRAQAVEEGKIEAGSDTLHVIPDLLPLDDAICMPELALALAALRIAEVSGHSVAVLGLGNTGIFALQVLVAQKHASIVALDAIDCRRRRAVALGGCEVFNPQQYVAHIEARPLEAPARVLCFSPEQEDLALGIRLAADLSRVVAVGPLPADDARIPSYYLQIIVKEATIVGVSRPEIEDWSEAMSLQARGQLDTVEAYRKLTLGSLEADLRSVTGDDAPLDRICITFR